MGRKKQSYRSKILQYLKEHGSITNKTILKECDTTCPHSVIDALREKYIITDDIILDGGGSWHKVYKFNGPIEA